MAWSHTSPSPGILNHGIMGNVTEIPSGFTLKTMMFLGNGINAAMSEWGTLLRDAYDKPDLLSSRSKDMTLQYLGLSTDNGAYYYYNTVPGMNYQDTLIEVKKYSVAQQIPYAYVLIDSWSLHDFLKSKSDPFLGGIIKVKMAVSQNGRPGLISSQMEVCLVSSLSP